MNGAFYIGATGLQSQQTALDIIANNIANMNTPSFKRSEVRFAELLTPRSNVIGAAQRDSGMAGVAMDGATPVFKQGDLRQTGKVMDVAIDGEGFIELLGPGGQSVLWRGGTLRVGEDGFLVTANGTPLKAMISMPDSASEIVIGRDGAVRATVPGQDGPQDIGRIELVRVRDLSSLKGLGEGLYEAESDIGISAFLPGEDGIGALVQGSLESSNVELSSEMVLLLMMQRAYAANAQVLQAGDQLMSIANTLRR